MRAVLAEFTGPDAAIAGARQARASGFPLVDALTPYPLDALAELVGTPAPGLRVPMAIGGFGVAAALFALETWSAVVAYPLNEGGRPLFSWPVFLLSPFEVGVLAAAVTGAAAFLIRCGLPRLNHPYFEVPGVERATQDRFYLVLDPLDHHRSDHLRRMLFAAGAIAISEAEA